MLNTGTDSRRLPAGCPGALQRAHQRKPAFIDENQGSIQRSPLFLSAARRSVSSERSLHRHARTCAVAVFGNSTPNVVTHTKRHSADNAPETTARSIVQSAPRSSNLRHGRGHTPRAPRLAPNSAAAKRTNDWDAPLASSAGASQLGTRDANVAHYVRSCRSVWPPVPNFVRLVTIVARADGDLITV
jgi:hypothetical protein